MEKLNEKGLRESLVGLAEVSKAIANARSRAERALTEAEAELNALLLVNGFVQQQLADYRARLAALLEAQKEAQQ